MVNLVLVGGGHSHSIVLKLWSKNRVSGVKITLISNVKNTPYSGMLPEYISGFYSYEESHINLVRLAEVAGIELIIDEVINIDAEEKIVSCQWGLKIGFDVLSLDIGSTPEKSQIEGANLYGIPVKPIPLFLKKWHEVIDLAENNPDEKMILTMVGGGASGIELALNIHSKLIEVLSQKNLIINIIHRGMRILSNHSLSLSKKLTKILEQRQINIYLNQEVQSIESKKVTLFSGESIDSDYTFLVTQASAPFWLKNSSIETDPKGFIMVKNTLQSVNYSDIFASGDIAHIRGYPCAKAGVFAVKQGIPLYQNLCAYLKGKPLRLYYPQKNYLNIIGIGNKNAVASWGDIALESRLIWYWKQYLDQNFMRQFKS